MKAKKYPTKLAERKRKRDGNYSTEVRRAKGFALAESSMDLVLAELNRRKDRRRLKQQAKPTPPPTGDFFFLAALTSQELQQLVNKPRA